MSKRSIVLTVAVAALLGLAAQPPLVAESNIHRTMFVTFSRPVQLPGVTLDAGTYIFEVANPLDTSDVVRVISRDRRRPYYLGLTRKIDRPANAPERMVMTFGEAPAGTPPPIDAWYPAADTLGRQFIYRR